MKYIPGRGSTPNPVMLISQGPGKAEGQMGYPFAGPSGEQQDMYLSYFGLRQSQFYITNLMKLWRPQQPKPTDKDIEIWGPQVTQEIAQCNPRIIGAIGAIAARWLLEPHYPNISLSMDLIHGLAFPLPNDRIVIPIEHPASGLHSPNQKPSIFYDYSQLAQAIVDPSKCRYAHLNDPYKGKEDYRCVNGRELADLLRDAKILSVDTEGNKRHKVPESIQFSCKPGTGYSLRIGCEDFYYAIGFAQGFVDSNIPVVVHNALFDIPMARLMGLELERSNINDTMYMLFVLGGWERLGLDSAGYRFCGARTDHFLDVVGDACRAKQIAYLTRASQIDWGKTNRLEVLCNNGTIKSYKPGTMNSKLTKILKDIDENKADKDGNPVDPEDRFYRAPGNEPYHKEISRNMIREVEDELGPFPWPSLRDIPDDDAVYYECRDADIPLRLYETLIPILHQYNVYETYLSSMRTLPAIEEIQRTGVPCKHSYFPSLQKHFRDEARTYQQMISWRCFNGEAFNPKSNPQTVKLLESLGETGLDRTKPSAKHSKGQVSTAEDSILWLQNKHEPVRWLFKSRHYTTLANNFCQAIIDRADPDHDISPVCADWKYTGPPTRRLATSGKSRKSESGFNLLGMPSRGKESLMIRQGFECPPGMVLVGCDLSQIEPRVMTHFSQDPLLLAIYQNNRDIYVETACAMENIASDQVTKDKRQVYKIFMLGQMYGFGPFTMMKLFFKEGIFEFNEQACEEMITSWYGKHYGVTKWKDSLAEEARRTGYVFDASGMRRYVPDVRSKNKRDRAQAERWAVSQVVQGTAQTIIQNSMAWLERKLWQVRDMNIDMRLCLQYHDELVTWTWEEFAEQAGRLLVEAMTKHTGMELSVPVKAEYVIGRNWAELKG